MADVVKDALELGGLLNPVTSGPEALASVGGIASDIKGLFGGGGASASGGPGGGVNTTENIDSRGFNEALLANPKEEIATFDKAKAAKKAKATQDANTAAREAEIKAVQDSPWTQLGDSLVKQYQQEETPVAALVGGQGIPQAQQAAVQSAEALTGLSPGSSAGQWLAQATAAGQAEAAPVAAAMQQEGAQYAAEQGPISAALSAWGQANALSEITAPEQSWLSALASHVTSNLSYQGVVPKAALSSLSPAVATALQQSGGYGGSAGSGTVPIQNVVGAAGGGSKATGGATTPGTPQTGIVPGAGTNAGS